MGIRRSFAHVYLWGFIALLIPDVAGALILNSGAVSILGGAGIDDGLFRIPLFTAVLVMALNHLRSHG